MSRSQEQNDALMESRVTLQIHCADEYGNCVRCKQYGITVQAGECAPVKELHDWLARVGLPVPDASPAAPGG